MKMLVRRGSLLALVLASACGGGDPGTPDASSPDAAPDPAAICGELGLPQVGFAAGPYGQRRGDVADDFSVELIGGATWTLREQWAGCESYVFLPDSIPISDADSTSIWTQGVEALIAGSPRNVHYFFVSLVGQGNPTAEMATRIDTALATLSEADAAHWRAHLHVVAKPSYQLENWLEPVLVGIGRGGFAIDRGQRVRGVGMLADVARYDSNIQGWPFASNLAYAAHEATYYNGSAERQAALAAEDATIVPMWNGEVLTEGFAEADITLPSADAMAGFDTLIVDVTQQCPDPDKIEFGNCGAWDYLAYLWVRDDASGTWIELARFITTYHREAHWTIDVSPMLAHLRAGGTRHFKWEWAPDWNRQPTATQLSLRLSNRGKGHAPAEVVPLFTGGTFNSHYNDARAPIEVLIPADAARVELFTLVTGHGADDSNSCAEFCNHQHEITVGATTHRKEFPMASTDAGCVAEVANGMTPNQGGTWWYGRGGWCPGEAVTPWIVDITDDVTPGQTATISYRGLFDNGSPPDVANQGEIKLTSYLVVSR